MGKSKLQVYTRHKGLGSSESERELRTESFSFSGGRVRFGSKADILSHPHHVRFTPESEHS
jgi:hypothetical protein